MGVRADKYIWSVRLAKTRSKASEAISKGRVLINGQTTKPSKDVNAGDVITLIVNTAQLSYKIIQLLDRRVGAKLVTDYIIDITPEEETEKLRIYKLAQQTYREFGDGKPTKKDRRSLDDFLNNWEEL